MAALTKKHGDDAQPLSDNSEDQRNSEEGSNNEGSADDGDGGEGSNGEEDGDDSNANAGWAEAMAKILGKKTPESRSSILVKSKELDKMKGLERQEQLERKKQVDKKRAWEMMCREKPDVVKDRDTERALQRIATRGVVQLFNAVRKHQKTVDIKVKEVGGSERKKAKLLSSVTKKDFIDVLRGTEGGSARNTAEDTTVDLAEKQSSWSVLSDDFMMGATMKDWDKDSDREENDAVHTG